MFLCHNDRAQFLFNSFSGKRITVGKIAMFTIFVLVACGSGIPEAATVPGR